MHVKTQHIPEISLGFGLISRIPTRNIRAMGEVPLAIEQPRAAIERNIPMQDLLGHYEIQYQGVRSINPRKALGITKRTCPSLVSPRCYPKPRPAHSNLVVYSMSRPTSISPSNDLHRPPPSPTQHQQPHLSPLLPPLPLA